MDHDLIVVGGGAAGLGAVRAALWAGADVAMVTDSAPGGECTFTGCVPSKTLLAAARDGLDFAEAMARVRATVEHIAATESAEVLRAEGATVIEGRARLVTHDTVAVGDRRTTAPRIVLATGSRPSLPDIPGLAEAQPLTNETVFDLTEAPKSLGIIGGGATGCELAQAFAAFGTEVTLFEQRSQLLPSEEPEAAATVRAALQDCGVRVLRCVRVAAVESLGPAGAGGSGPYRVLRRHRRSGGLTDPVVVERLLVAAGRTPVTQDLGLEEMGFKSGPHGIVITDSRLATSIKGVYAAGDVTAWPPPPPAGGRRFKDHLVERGVIDAAGRLRARPDSERVQAALADLGIRTGTLVLPDVRFGLRGRLADKRRRFEQRDRWHFHFRRLRHRSRDRQGAVFTTLPSRMLRREECRARVRLSPGRGRPRRADLRRLLAGGPRAMLSHSADEMGRIAAGNALGKGLRGRFGAGMVPRVVFTDPEVASVGVIPWHAPPRSRVAYLPLAEVDRAITDGRTDGFIAIVAGPRRLLRNAGGGRILGATIVAPRAGEMIQEIVLAMRTKAFAGRLAQASHAYPTWSGGVQKAAAQFFGEIEGRQARRA